MSRAREIDDPARLMLGHRIAGVALYWRGDQREAASHLERCVALYELQRDRDSALLYGGIDLKASALGWLGRALLHLGYPDKALAAVEEARQHAAALKFPHTVAVVEYCRLVLHWMLLDHDRVVQSVKEAMPSLEKYGIWMFHRYARSRLGACLVALGRADEGVPLLEQALKEAIENGERFARSVFIEALALAATQSKEWPRATALYEEALHEYEAIGSDCWEADVRRSQGEFFLARDGLQAGAAAAEACFHKSLEVARRQGSRWFELRTAVSLARLWHAQGKTREARELLAPIYGWFTEGFDTRDLKAARALLDALN